MSKPVSLEAYAAAHPRRKGGLPCWACNIPEAAEINEQRLKGVSVGVIFQWLRTEKGYQDVTKGKLEAHFINSRHHERPVRGATE